MELTHYPRGQRPFTLDRTRTYSPARKYDKPDGLWVSVKGPDDWQSWTKFEDFAADTTGPGNEYTIHLADGANLLHLQSVIDIHNFTDEYQLDTPPGFVFDRGYRIDWPRLADECDGIVIAPYQWACRNDDRTFWYYTWDCASGCIWNLDAIESVTAPHAAAKAG